MIVLIEQGKIDAFDYVMVPSHSIDFCIEDTDGRGVQLSWVFGWLVITL